MNDLEAKVAWVLWCAAVLALGLVMVVGQSGCGGGQSPSAACTAVRAAEQAAQLAEPYVCEMDGGTR